MLVLKQRTMSKNVLFIIILFTDITHGFGDIEVNTRNGKIAGKRLKTIIKNNEYYGFMGIPYAAPPIKELRFKPPQNIEPWTEVLQAKKEKPACIQFNSNVVRSRSFGRYGAEDCLYLDIFTPGVDENKRAVVIFLYNERFQSSYNKTKDYGPDFFIEEDVVLVKVGHRLAMFGFLSFEDDILPGNAGLKDIATAIEWIYNNIEYFGGDTKRITLMGSQGGAVAVDFLIRSKIKILINSAILQSGTALVPLYLQEGARDRAHELAKLLNVFTENKVQLLKELNEIPAADLFSNEFKAAPSEYNKDNQRGVLSFGPIVENSPDGLITEYPENFQEQIDIPILIGFNNREGLSASMQYLTEPRYLRFVHKDFPLLLPLRLNFKFDPAHKSYHDAIKEIRKYYFSKRPITENSISDYITFAGDVLTAYPIDKMVKIYSNISSQPLYYYHFNYYSDLNENKNNILQLSVVDEGTWGAATGDELCYLFSCPKLRDKYTKYNRLESEEIIMQRTLTRMWANFAKFGNPTPKKDETLKTQWPPYDVNNKHYLHIDKEITVKSNVQSDNINFWDKFIQKWEKRFKNGLDKYYKNDEL